MFSTLSETQVIIWTTFEIASANALKLDWSKKFVIWQRFDSVTGFNDSEKESLLKSLFEKEKINGSIYRFSSSDAFCIT